jgi:hypothetical protein
MDDVDQGDIGDDGRQEGVLDDIHIGDAHVFHHQKGGGPHDRRHELAVGGAGHLHGTGLFRGEADLFHQGNGEGAGGDHVGDGGAGDQPGQPEETTAALAGPPRR